MGTFFLLYNTKKRSSPAFSKKKENYNLHIHVEKLQTKQYLSAIGRDKSIAYFLIRNNYFVQKKRNLI
jgi:hypothetical protein